MTAPGPTRPPRPAFARGPAPRRLRRSLPRAPRGSGAAPVAWVVALSLAAGVARVLVGGPQSHLVSNWMAWPESGTPITVPVAAPAELVDVPRSSVEAISL